MTQDRTSAPKLVPVVSAVIWTLLAARSLSRAWPASAGTAVV